MASTRVCWEGSTSVESVTRVARPRSPAIFPSRPRRPPIRSTSLIWATLAATQVIWTDSITDCWRRTFAMDAYGQRKTSASTMPGQPPGRSPEMRFAGMNCRESPPGKRRVCSNRERSFNLPPVIRSTNGTIGWARSWCRARAMPRWDSAPRAPMSTSMPAPQADWRAIRQEQCKHPSSTPPVRLHTTRPETRAAQAAGAGAIFHTHPSTRTMT